MGQSPMCAKNFGKKGEASEWGGKEKEFQVSHCGSCGTLDLTGQTYFQMSFLANSFAIYYRCILALKYRIQFTGSSSATSCQHWQHPSPKF